MNPIGVTKYIFFSAVFVVCFVTGIRLIFAHDMRRDFWRSNVKRHIYISAPRFKSLTVVSGWLLLVFSLYIAFIQIDQLITRDD